MLHRTYQLTEHEIQKATEFIKLCEDKQEEPMTAIGGRFTLCFTTTSIGVMTSIRDGVTGEEESITDFDKL